MYKIKTNSIGIYSEYKDYYTILSDEIKSISSIY